MRPKSAAATPAPRAGVWVLAAALAALAAAYFLCRKAYYPGAFNDDAYYALGARSLLHGSYLDLASPGRRPQLFFPPGTSLILAPAALFAGDAFWPFQLVSALLTLASFPVFLFLFEGTLSRAGLWLAALAWAANPFTACLSGAVLSEPPFLLLVLSVLALARRHWASRSARVWAGLGALAGLAFLVRTPGWVLGAALLAGLLVEKREDEAAACAGGALAAALPWLARSLIVGGFVEIRLFQLVGPYVGAGGPAALARAAASNAAYYGCVLFGDFLFPAQAAWLRGLAVLLGLAAAGWGLRRGGFAGWRRVAALFVLLYAGILLAWPMPSPRYLHCILPLAAAWTAAGAEEAGRALGWRHLGAAAMGVSLLLNLAGLGAAAGSSLGFAPPRMRAAERTYAWIRRETPADALFIAESGGRLYLQTRRLSVRPPVVGGSAEVEAWRLGLGARYALIEPMGAGSRPAGSVYGDGRGPAELKTLLAVRGGWELAFADPAEGTEVYRLKDGAAREK